MPQSPPNFFARQPALTGPFWSRTPRVTADALTWFLVALGILLRVLEYQSGRTLYMDERSLLQNLNLTSILDFHTTLTEEQLAPPAFLVIERSLVRLPIDQKMSGRLFPVMCGIGSMLVFRLVARRYSSPLAVPVAVGLFALADWLIYYSAEIKQYSTDLVLTLIAIWLAAGPVDQAEGWPASMSPRWRQALLWFGVVAVWLSYPLALVLAGVGTYLIAEAWRRGDRRRAVELVMFSLVWVLSFAGCFKVSHTILSKGRFIWDWWDFAFLRFPPRSLAALQTEVWQIVNVTNAPGSVFTPLGVMTTALLAAGLFLVGAAALAKRWRGGLYLLLAPIAFVIVASSLHQYPFHGRLLIFIVPSVHLLIAEGVYTLTRGLGPRATFLAGAFLLAQPAYEAMYHQLVQRSARGYDSHGDLRPDLLDYLENLEDRRRMNVPMRPQL